MAAFWRGHCSLWSLWSLSRFLPVHSRVQFLSAAEASPGLSGAAWQPLAGCQYPSTQIQESQCQFFIFYIVSLIMNITSIISVISKAFYIQFVSLSPFSSFSLSLMEGWGLIQNICHSVYWCPALNQDKSIDFLPKTRNFITTLKLTKMVLTKLLGHFLTKQFSSMSILICRNFKVLILTTVSQMQDGNSHHNFYQCLNNQAASQPCEM